MSKVQQETVGPAEPDQTPNDMSGEADGVGAFDGDRQLDAWIASAVLPTLEDADRHPERMTDAETVRRRVLARLEQGAVRPLL